jgi:recombination associated protein RdgC
MTPRNLTLFRFGSVTGLDVLTRLAEVVPQYPFFDPGPATLQTSGFAMIDGAHFVRHVGTRLQFCVETGTRQLQMSHVNRTLDRTVANIAELEGRKVGGRERKRMRDDIIARLLPHAPIRYKRVYGWFDLSLGWLCLDTASPKEALHVVGQLREALGSLPVVPPAPELSPRTEMTAWLDNYMGAPVEVALGDECELNDRAAPSGPRAIFRRQDLQTDEIFESLSGGKTVKRLALGIEGLQFVLDENLVLRKLKFDLQDDEEDGRNPGDASFFLQASAVAGLLDKMTRWFNIPPVGAA